MSTPALNPLVEKVRAAHPGAYDDMDDATLTKRMLAKYPQYSDLAAPSIQRPEPAELKPGMTQANGKAMPFTDAVKSGPFTPPGQAESAMGFGNPISEQNKTEGKAIGLAAATAAPILSAGASLPIQMGIGGLSGAAQSKLQGGSNTEAALSGGIGAVLPTAAPVMGKLGQSAKVILNASGKTAEEIPGLGGLIKAGKAGTKALGGLKDIWAPEAPPIYPGAPLPGPVPEGAALSQGTTSMGLSRTGEALGNIPVKTPPEPVVPQTKAAVGKKLVSDLNEGLGGRPLQPNVPLKEQGAQAFKAGQAEGERIHGPLSDKVIGPSTAVQDFHYDPAKQELTVTAKDGIGHVYGEVTQDQADAFEKASSKGKAWKDIRDNNVKVAKISPEGTRTPNKGATQFKVASPNESDDLTGILQQSLKKVQGGRQ